MSSKNIYLSNFPNQLSKYFRWYESIVMRASTRTSAKSYTTAKRQFSKAGVYFEGHHIWPRSLGTEQTCKDFRNIVFLTAREHYVCHHLLTKCFSGFAKDKMMYAFRMMTFVKASSGSCGMRLQHYLREAHARRCAEQNGIAIDQYDIFGRFIQSFQSIKNASEQVGFANSCSINQIISNPNFSRDRTPGGFVWVKKGEFPNFPLVWGNRIPVVCENTKTVYRNATLAASVVGGNSSGILKSIRANRLYHGLRWRLFDIVGDKTKFDQLIFVSSFVCDQQTPEGSLPPPK